ncbi:MAG: ABC transporter substrate-binding protein [Actinomycetota bacterium]
MQSSFSRPAAGRRSLLTIFAVVALIAAACGDGETDTAAAPATAESSSSSSSEASATDESSSSEESPDPSVDGEAAAPTDEIDNCGVTVTAGEFDRVVTMNQGATEIALALGFGDRMIGTAYLDDAILPELAADYEGVPVVSDEYPSTEALFELEPDFVYGSYSSAFGEEAAGERGELADLGVGSYLSPAACADFKESGEPVTFDVVFDEFVEFATAMGDPAAGEKLVAEQRALLDESFSGDFESVTVFWWDGGLDAPFTGVCCGAPGMIMDAVGVTNAFGDVDGAWADVTWESVIDTDPDVIVLIDASWDPAADKRAHLENDPALADLTAVQEERYVVVPFSSSTPGVRNAAVVGEIASLIEELDLAG